MPEFFTPAEMACHCGRDFCAAAPMAKSFMDRLNALRAEWGHPLIITSARRCPWWNQHVGGAKGSKHLEGRAVDIKMLPIEIPKFITLAEKYGFNGLGVGATFIHIDDRSEPARWTY